MGRLALERLPSASAAAAASAAASPSAAAAAASGAIFACASCGAHLAPREALVSDNFTGRTGPALLVRFVLNSVLGAAEARVLRSGAHVVCDIFCACCGEALGWHYLRAPGASEEYKVGASVLERARVRDEVVGGAKDRD